MAQKVKLPAAVAKGIEELHKEGYSGYDILCVSEGAIVSEPALTIRRWAFDGAGSPDLLMAAIVNGYEVELSPEERLREYYEERRVSGLVGADQAKGVRKALEILGITIEGINV